MTALLERKAIFSKEQVKDDSKPYQVVYKKEEFLDAQKNTAQVSTSLHVPTEKVDLGINYKLKKGAQGWQIFDVIVDSASLVENYKFQFDTIIRAHGYADLVARKENKTAITRSSPPTSITAAIHDLGALSQWCHDLIRITPAA